MGKAFIYGFLYVTPGGLIVLEEDAATACFNSLQLLLLLPLLLLLLLLLSFVSTILYNFLFMHTLTDKSTGLNSVRYSDDPSQTDKSIILGSVALMPMI